MKKFLIILLITFLYILPARTATIQDKIIENAMNEIGHGEEGRDNYGWDIHKYLNGVEGMPWCSGFVSYILKESGYKKFPYYLSAISYYKDAKQKNLLTNKPQRGDLIVFWRIKKSPLKSGHIGIILKVEKDYIYSIEGNTGKFPSIVKVIKHKRNENKILGYIKIR